MPSATTKRPRSASRRYASSLCRLLRPTSVSPNAETLTPRLSLPPEDTARGLAFPAETLLRAHLRQELQRLGVLGKPRKGLLEVTLGLRIQPGQDVELARVAMEERVVAVEFDRRLDGIDAPSHLSDDLHAGEREIVKRLRVLVVVLHGEVELRDGIRKITLAIGLDPFREVDAVSYTH